MAIRPVQPFAQQSRAPRARVLAVIRAAIDAGNPVLVALRSAYNHYTVIAGYTRALLILHDSYAYCWVAAASCGVRHDGAPRRHQLATRSIIVLEVW